MGQRTLIVVGAMVVIAASVPRMTLRTTAAPLVQSPVAYYEFSESSGTTSADSSGNNIRATLYNGASFTTGRTGNAVQFDGADDHVQIADDPRLNDSTNFTIAAWVRLNALGGDHTIYQAGGSTTDAWRFRIEGGKLTLRAQSYARPWPAASIADTNWHHVALTKAGTGPNNVTFYVDGVNAGVASSADSGMTVVQSGTKYVGGWASFSVVYAMNGALDDVAYYNRVLSAAEINQLRGTSQTPPPPPPPDPSPSPAPPSPVTAASGFEAATIASGLNHPTAMAFAPDGRIFVAEQSGAIRVIKNDVLLSTPFATIPVTSGGEEGLLGIAFDPNFATNRYLYVYYTIDRHNRLSRFQANASNPDVVAAGSEAYIIANIGDNDGNGTTDVMSANHNGGVIHFGRDGMLYVGVGEHGNPANSQDLRTLAGKMLRLNVANYPGSIIPTDNPFVSQSGARREIYALGLRNPFTFNVDPVDGRIYVNDVGGDREEINRVVAGANYGWPTCGGGPCGNAAYTDPLFSYVGYGLGEPSCAITGGAFYRGSNFPSSYNGTYLFADYCGDFVRRLNSNNTSSSWADGFAAPVDVEVSPSNGMVYVLDWEAGTVTRIRYIGSGNQNPVARISANPLAGAAPLDVTFDGSASSDPEGSTLTYAWNFGDGATSSQALIHHTYSAAGSYQATLTVTDTAGGSNSAMTTINVGTPPSASIDTPVAGTMYSAGNTIGFSGSATDARDGTLPPSAFSWTVLFHHDTHSHPVVGPLNGVTSGSFTIPTYGHTEENVWYRIYLTVTNSAGLQRQVTRDVLPRKVTVTVDTTVAGAQVLVDGTPHPAPYSFVGVVGVQRSLGVTSPQTINGSTYQFVSWSNGGAQTQTISTPTANTTYRATLQTSQAAPGPVLRYTFSESSGTSTADSSGNNLHALLQNGPTFVAGHTGNALRFDGINDQAQIADNALLNGITSFTIAAWVKLNTTTGSFNIYQSGTSGTPWMFRIESGKLTFRVSTYARPWPGVAIADTNWHHVAIVKNGTGANNLTFYVDGANVGTVSSTDAGTLTAPSGVKYIGSRFEYGRPNEVLNGLLDDFVFYNRALTAAEVSALR